MDLEDLCLDDAVDAAARRLRRRDDDDDKEDDDEAAPATRASSINSTQALEARRRCIMMMMAMAALARAKGENVLSCGVGWFRVTRVTLGSLRFVLCVGLSVGGYWKLCNVRRTSVFYRRVWAWRGGCAQSATNRL